MQSVALYGRLVARAIVAGIHNEFQLRPGARDKQPLHLVTGSYGFSKSVAKNSVLKKWTFGDDAYFIARNKVADVIGKYSGSYLYICQLSVGYEWYSGSSLYFCHTWSKKKKVLLSVVYFIIHLDFCIIAFKIRSSNDEMTVIMFMLPTVKNEGVNCVML